MVKTINFFTNSLDISGAETALYHNLKAMNPSIQKRLIVEASGYWVDKISNIEVIQKIIYSNKYESYTSFSNLFTKFTRKITKTSKDNHFLRWILKKYPSDYWYINTIMHDETLNFAKKNNIPVILHVHELENMLEGKNYEMIETMIFYPKHIIASSVQVKKMLNVLGRTENITVVYPGMDFDSIVIKNSKNDIKTKLEIPEKSKVIGMSGLINNNKNPSLFIKVAKSILDSHNDIYFLWLGDSSFGAGYYAKKEAVFLGIDKHLKWVSVPKNEYYDYLNIIDVFFMTSLRESFSLVTLEALYLKKNIVTMNSGGSTEILNDDKIGTVISSCDVEIVSKKILSLLSDTFSFDTEMMAKRHEFFSIKHTQIVWNNLINSLLYDKNL